MPIFDSTDDPVQAAIDQTFAKVLKTGTMHPL